MFRWALIRCEPSKTGSYKALLPWGASRWCPGFWRSTVPDPGSPGRKDRLGTPHPWTGCQPAGTAASGLRSPASNTWWHSCWIRARLRPLFLGRASPQPWTWLLTLPARGTALSYLLGGEYRQVTALGGAGGCPTRSNGPGGRRYQECKYIPEM